MSDNRPKEYWEEELEDTVVCPRQGLIESEERRQAEERRLAKAVQNVEKEPEQHRDELLIYLEGLPARSDAPLSISVRGDVYYNSGSIDGTVHDVVIKIPHLREDQTVPVLLKIAAKKFESTINVALAEGSHLKLAMEQGKGFHMAQQTKPFGTVLPKLKPKDIVPALQANKEKVPPSHTSGGISTAPARPAQPRPAPAHTPPAAVPTVHAETRAEPQSDLPVANEELYASEEEVRLARVLKKKGYGDLTK